jgi:hypothetical protein
MSITTISTLQAGRVGIREYVKLQSAQMEKQYPMLVNEINTSQEFERFRQYSEFGYAQPTDEGGLVAFDQKQLLYTADFTPIQRTLGFSVTKQAKFTDQYGVLSGYSKDIAQAFIDTKELVVANLFNNGFSASYAGIDGVSLFNTAHPLRGISPTWSNRGDTSGADVTFGPLGLQSMLTAARKQRTSRNKPGRFSGKMNLVVPPDLEFPARIIMESAGQAGTSNNDANVVKSRLNLQIVDNLTSTTAFFLMPAEKSKHGLFLLYRMPFDTDADKDVKTGTEIYVASEEYVTGWKHAYNLQGTSG